MKPDAPKAEAATASALPERPLAGRVTLLLGVLALLLAIVYLSPVKAYLGQWREISDQVRRMESGGPIVFALGVAVLVAMGFPRLLFCVIGGMTFGFGWGLLWTQTGTLAGNYLTFIFARWGGRHLVSRWLARRPKVNDLIRREGISAVLLARQVPVPGLFVNLAFGVSPVRQRQFLLGTALGQLPEAIPCVLIGCGMRQSSLGLSVGAMGLAGLILLMVWIGWRFVMRALRKGESRSDSPAPTV